MVFRFQDFLQALREACDDTGTKVDNIENHEQLFHNKSHLYFEHVLCFRRAHSFGKILYYSYSGSGKREYTESQFPKGHNSSYSE